MSTQEVLDQIDAAVSDWEVGPDAMRMNGPPSGQIMVTIQPDFSGFMEAMSQAAVAWGDAMKRTARTLASVDWAGIKATIDGLDGTDKHHPPPLCINGHAYNRRRKARRKR